MFATSPKTLQKRNLMRCSNALMALMKSGWHEIKTDKGLRS